MGCWFQVITKTDSIVWYQDVDGDGFDGEEAGGNDEEQPELAIRRTVPPCSSRRIKLKRWYTHVGGPLGGPSPRP